MTVKLEMTLRLEREDEIPAFGAFLRCEEQHDLSPVILVNVQTVMSPELTDEEGDAVAMTREDRKRLLITTMIHEFGHALESHFKLPVNEDAIERACESWETAYSVAKENQSK